MSAEIRIVQSSDASRILSLYESLGYRQGIAPDDTVWIAEAAGEPIGIVRIAPEFGVLVLRGMRIAEPWRHRGLGTQMLRVLDAWLDGQDCYCVPYSHLPGFYRQIGFKEIMPEAAPPFLAARLNDYKQRGLKVILMARLTHSK
jgi:N-acetylglutamate synthase-like GNAT family acetyltransferase